jgi:hypothetical protein
MEKAKPEIKEMIKLFGLPEKCPIEKVSSLRSHSKIDIN